MYVAGREGRAPCRAALVARTGWAIGLGRRRKAVRAKARRRFVGKADALMSRRAKRKRHPGGCLYGPRGDAMP
ncbi:MAG: hypothetical protein EAZ40_07610 [Rhodobacterales bacterium]|nr:MAG: hypothetical protein EAZ40_07610 [Rhodobacterales bacterium]